MLAGFCGTAYTLAEQKYIEEDSVTQLIYNFIHYGDSPVLLASTKVTSVKMICEWSRVHIYVPKMTRVEEIAKVPGHLLEMNMY